jgi:aminomethyltransferase
VYRLLDDHFLLVVNAGNIMKDYEWMAEQARHLGGDAAVVNSSSRYALLALQGPRAAEVLQTLTAIDLPSIRYYWFAAGEVAGIRATVSRTGYTGEDGFEVFVPPAQAERLWDAILGAGEGAGVRPCGLGARDTLRLEAAMRLYGNDMDDETTVLEAGLGWIVGWKKDKFLGSDRLREQKAQGVQRKLAAFEVKDRGIARHGHSVLSGTERVGVVTSGTQTPFLKKAIGFAMVPIQMASVGSALTIDVRGRHLQAEVVPEPFYKRSKT